MNKKVDENLYLDVLTFNIEVFHHNQVKTNKN